MKAFKSIAGFAFRRGLESAVGQIPFVGAREAAAWTTSTVLHHFSSHGTELTAALQTAHESAWGALAFSLGDDSALDLLRSRDNHHLREQMRTFLQNVASGRHPEASRGEFRHHCLEQLRSAKKAGLLEGGGIDMQELCRHVGSFAEVGNAATLLDAERAALSALSAEFPANQYPDLRKLLDLAPGDGAPFLIVAAEFFFKRQIAASEPLARVVGYDLQIALLREQRDGQAQIILKMDQQARKLMEQFALMKIELRPQDGYSMHDETERRLVRSLLKQFREQPPELQSRLPDLLGDLGRLAFAAGEFKESRAASSEAARLAPAESAQASAHYNAYLASLQDRDWAAALESLQRAADLDAPRWMPFPFDHYLPVGILGAGGFGVAFLCNDQYLGRRVVVKTLQPAQVGRDMKELFGEANILESLTHDGIVRVRHADYADAERKRPYLVMDWFDGPSLDDHVHAHGPLTLDQALEMGRQLAEALAAAHESGILHRDVKPRNVLIRLAGGRVQVKLIDFGLALQESAARTLASGHTLLGSSQAGTLDYAAPEQLGKLPGVKPGAYSDVYAWARTLCFALFGTPHPLPGNFLSCSKALLELLDNALAADVSKRPSTMQLLLEMIAGCRQHAPEYAPATATYRPPKEARTSRFVRNASDYTIIPANREVTRLSSLTLPESPEYVLLWMFAEATANASSDDETRITASRMLNFICKNGYTNIEIHPDDYEFLQQECKRDRQTLTKWDAKSPKVDLVAGRIRVNPEALLIFLRENAFSARQQYKPHEADRQRWFELLNPLANEGAPEDRSSRFVGTADDYTIISARPAAASTDDRDAAGQVSVNGTSPSTHRAPRVLDLANDGDDLMLHIHMPGRDQRRFWVNRLTLQSALDGSAGPSAGARMEIAARSRRAGSAVTLVFREGSEIEIRVRDGWWIWVGESALKDALEELGFRVPFAARTR